MYGLVTGSRSAPLLLELFTTITVICRQAVARARHTSWPFSWHPPHLSCGVGGCRGDRGGGGDGAARTAFETRLDGLCSADNFYKGVRAHPIPPCPNAEGLEQERILGLHRQSYDGHMRLKNHCQELPGLPSRVDVMSSSRLRTYMEAVNKKRYGYLHTHNYSSM